MWHFHMNKKPNVDVKYSPRKYQKTSGIIVVMNAYIKGIENEKTTNENGVSPSQTKIARGKKDTSTFIMSKLDLDA